MERSRKECDEDKIILLRCGKEWDCGREWKRVGRSDKEWKRVRISGIYV